MKGNRWEKRRTGIGILLVICWMTGALFFTIIGREPASESQVNLQLFWCIKEAWGQRNALDWYFVIGNILLFVPLGFILPLFYKGLRSWWKVTCIGMGSSVAIEWIQFVKHLGLSELDDVFNNTLGCYLGYALAIILLSTFGKKTKKGELVSALAMWICIIGFFVFAVWIGQPVLEYW